MALEFFNPFQDMVFDDHFCFLSGDLATDSMTVFPEWLIDRFKLGDEKITLMENSQVKMVSYHDLKLPGVQDVKEAFEDLDLKVQVAYKNGYEGMAQLDEMLLFQWSGRIVYGLLYLEMMGEWKRHQQLGKEFKISPNLRERLGKFQVMLQSVIKPVSFSERKPWSLIVFPLKYSDEILSYRDDVINLMFQFGVNGFGFIICFQDNGVIEEKHSEIIEKMKGHTLHPIQFEELYASFHYSVERLQYKPQYTIEHTDQELKIEALPVEQTDSNKPLFSFFQDDFYARLLSNYWQVYGIEKGDIIQFQKPLLSYLENQHNKDFIDPETIELPF